MAATRAPVDRSTLRLSEVARHLVIPEGIIDSLWFEVEERCREFGDTFDVWQDGLGQVMLGLREDGMFAATVGGIAMSIPRQVAKTFIVGRTVVALCSLYPDLTFLWTAHHLRTSTMTFDKLKAFVTRRQVRQYLEPGRNQGTAIRDANGEQEIPFANGSRIMFGARSQGFGRGFDEVDGIVFDEAQILTLRALEDMLPATNQSRFAHGALLFYMGTPPRPDDPGEMFTARRKKALAAKAGLPDFSEPVATGDALYVECSADADVGRPGGPSLDDPQQVETGNPSYPHRTPPVSVARLRENLPDDDAWRREGLGVWDEDEADEKDRPLDPDAWRGRADLVPLSSWPLAAIGLDMDPLTGRLWTTVAAFSDDGVHVELLPDDLLVEGMDAAVERIFEQVGRRLPVVMPADSGATVLVPAMRAKRMLKNVYVLNVPEQAQACSSLVQAVKDGTLSHLDDPVLDLSVRESEREWLRTGGGQWRYKRSGELKAAPLWAATAAHMGAIKWSKRRTSGRSGGRREAVVL